ncbi:MAG: hypothetical protein AAGC92_04475 [Pseudomonadota bacterium]
MSAPRLVLNASGGRTGTQFFGDMLGRIVADCYSEHEPDMIAGFSRLSLARVRRFGRWHMVLGRALGRTGVRSLGQALLEGRIEPQICVERLRSGRVRLHAGARLAGVIRDPRSWIASWLRHARDAAMERSANAGRPGR